jgi:hypothetical protein
VEKLVRSELRVREQQAQATAAAADKAVAAAAAAKQAAAAVAKQTAERNRAQQLNPACTAFWTSRGYESAPWRWDVFEEGSELARAHKWPPLIANMREYGFDTAVSKLSCCLNDSARNELRELYDDFIAPPPAGR